MPRIAPKPRCLLQGLTLAKNGAPTVYMIKEAIPALYKTFFVPPCFQHSVYIQQFAMALANENPHTRKQNPEEIRGLFSQRQQTFSLDLKNGL